MLLQALWLSHWPMRIRYVTKYPDPDVTPRCDKNNHPRRFGGDDCFLLTHDASFGVFEELDDGLNLWAIGHLILDLIDHIEDAGLSME